MLSRAGWCLATLSPSRAPWNLGFPLVSWRRARSAHRTRLQLHKSSPARGLSSPVARGIGLVSRVLQMVPMLAAGHVNGLGWDGGNARGRRATSWIAALLACALHVGIGSLIWRGMTPSPIPPAMPSDSESMFVELLAPPTPRAERSASPRGERAGRGARAGFRGDAGGEGAASTARARRAIACAAVAHADEHSKTCRQTRSQRQRDLASSPSLARASRLMCRPPARQRLRRAISVGSRRTRPRPANGARAANPCPGSRPRRRPNAPCCRARWRRPRVRLAAMRMRPGPAGAALSFG